MTDRDLTPAAARAEVEAFMGEVFVCGAHASTTGYYAYAHRPDFSVRVDGLGPTYRAAVDALKAAWRDAVRPWAMDAAQAGYDLACKPGINLVSKEECVARVLGEEA